MTFTDPIEFPEFVDNVNPTIAQWARAQALHEARAWLGTAFAALITTGHTVHAEVMAVEQLTLRWAKLIETGVLEEANKEGKINL